jgi:RNA polymerase sigma-70 factor (ECF subfamily)
MDRMSDAELVDRAREGDVDAFAELVDRHRARALRFAYGIAGDDAEDAVQDGFVKAFRNLSSFRAESEFRPWLFTIIGNEARNRRRSTTRRLRLAERTTRLPTAMHAADDEAVANETRARLVDAVSALPDRYREVVALRYFAGLSEAETAAVIGCPPGTAKSRLSRALERLRSELVGEVTL